MIIEVNTQSPQPIYEQIRRQIVRGIAAGLLEMGEELPSVRALAADLGVHFHTVNKAYAMLAEEGRIVMDRRRGAVVGEKAPRDHAFSEKLQQELTLAAAEAQCRCMDEAAFAQLCVECYKKAKGEGN
ncbi:MAG: GntR family transcriptional regulator [Clostridia bacterium]|nr:GntR family transcriptional regulator [Clostridia bacterium]